jgi:hypothetical protein
MMAVRIIAFFLTALLAIFSCRTPETSLYPWGQFDLKAANRFVSMADTLKEIENISIIDTRAGGNEFKVNKQTIFLDTNQTDQPNYYNYRKRAKEIGVDANSLLRILKTFYTLGVNEYRQKEDYYLFPVITGMFRTERGYLFSKKINAVPGDKIQTKQAGPAYNLILVKQVDKNWFEYVADK